MSTISRALIVGEKIDTSRDNFAAMVRENAVLVDKTLFIKAFWDAQSVMLITRPRRFGKTMNMSMLQNFFAEQVYGRPTKGLFDQFAISRVDDGKFLEAHQGRYPVIALSLKDLKYSSYESVIIGIRALIRSLYAEYEDILTSEKLTAENKAQFKTYLQGTVEAEALPRALSVLSALLFKAHQEEVIILIDEYDSPVTAAYAHDYLEPFSDFMRNMLGAAFKTNPYLKKGLMTGILRISQNEMLSGLNNLSLYTLFDTKFDEYFGFTETEVKSLMSCKQVSHDLSKVKAFYNGYKIGDTMLYNPWSIMNFLAKRELAPYWVMTSNDQLLKDILINAHDGAQAKFKALISGQTIEADIDLNLHYAQLIESGSALWTLLLFCGYLTVEHYEFTFMGARRRCQLSVPNAEVQNMYVGVFSEWLQNSMGMQAYANFLRYLTEGRVSEFTNTLGQFVARSLSVRDVSGQSVNTERFYHGFFVGLTASLQAYYDYTSNHEGGMGYYDVGLVPRDKQNPVGVVLEFKHAKANEKAKTVVDTALAQIDSLQYETVFKRHAHIKQVLKIGLSFCDKSVMSGHKITMLATGKSTDIEYNPK